MPANASLRVKDDEESLLPSDPFLDDVLADLTADHKTLPTKYLYDAEGSRLFEQICELPEYYVTRTEAALLERIAPDLSEAIPDDAALIEFGSGASTKTRLLLEAAPQIDLYVPIDISGSALEDAARSIRDEFPELDVQPLVADFTAPFTLPCDAVQRARVGFFPGSTIGNFAPDAAQDFLKTARLSLGDDPIFILGADLAKSADILVPAYDDAQGVTAAFNLNLLKRINRELGADFDLEAFAHRAVWNERKSRIEMHIVSLENQTVVIAGHEIRFAEGETIHTENSHKYRPEAIAELAGMSGWRIKESWISDPLPFGIFLLRQAA